METQYSYPLLFLLCTSFIVHIVFSGACKALGVIRGETFEPDNRPQRLVKLLEEANSVSLSLKLGRLVSEISFMGAAFSLIWFYSKQVALHYLVVLGGAVFLLSLVRFLVNELWSRFIVAHSRGYFELISLPLSLYFYLIKPVIKVIAKFLGGLSHRFKPNGNGISHQRILAMVHDSEDSELEAEERAMIHSIIGFGETEVHEIMVPRTDMVCVEEKANIEQLTELIREKGHSRLPLYAEDVDHILGIIYIKDLLALKVDVNKSVNLKALARKAYYVPENKRLDDLLKGFQHEKHHMAIVVDEYGGTAGLVTLEDVIEEIVGDIQDEYDEEPPLVEQLDENNYLVDAKIDLHELNASLEINLPTVGEYESLGGFILSLTGYVPAEKETVEFENYTFLIEEVDRNRIMSVKLTRNVNHDLVSDEHGK